MSFFKTSLDRACSQLRLPVKKRPRPSYLGQRAPTKTEWPDFEAYALDDARATYQLEKFTIERHQVFKIRPTVSVAAMAGKIFRSHCLRKDRIPLPEHGDLEQVRGLLGHTRLETTQLYAQIRPPALKHAVEFYESKALDVLSS